MTTEELLKVVGQAINVAKPDETEDMNAIVPAAVWRKVVDAHAALLYERARLTPPTDALVEEQATHIITEIIKAAVHRDTILRSKESLGDDKYFEELGKAEYMLDSAIAVFNAADYPAPSPPASKAEGE